MMEAILRKEIIANKTISRLSGMVIFIILTALGAFVRLPLPFTPVPITLQTFFVLLAGAFLGSRLGISAQLSYLLLGILGLPVFAGAGSGVFYLFGPTGGYIIGFVFASYFVGKFIGQIRNNFFSVFTLLYLGDFIILACGTIWLKFILGYSFNRLLFIGFIPFLPGDLFKVLFATALYLKLRARLKQIF